MTHEARLTGTGPGGVKMEYINGSWVPIPDDPGIAGAILRGAGATLENMARGAADLSSRAAGMIGTDEPEFRDKLAADRAAQDERLAPLRDQRPISTGVGEALPFVAGGLLGGAGRGLAAASRLTGVEAALGGLEARPGERVQGAAIAGAGGLVGAGALNVIQRVQRNIRQSSEAIRQARQPSDPLLLSGPGFPGRGGPIVRPGDPPGGFGRGSAGAAQREGSIVGTGSQSALRRVLQGAGLQVRGEGLDSPKDLEALITLRENDFFLKPGQQSGNIAAKQFFAGAERSPITADIVQQEIGQANSQNLNRRVLRTLGRDLGDEDVAEFSSSTLGALKRETGDVVDKIKKDHPSIVITDKTREQITKSVQDFDQSVTTLSKEDKGIRIVDKVLDVLDAPVIKTDKYTSMRSQLRGAQRKANASDETSRAQLLGEVIEALDQAFEATLPDVGTFRQFKQATQRFRLLEALGKQAVIKDGDVQVGALNRALKKVFKSEFGDDDRFGTFDGLPEFKNLFDVTQALGEFRDLIPNSGTPTALAFKDIISQPVSTALQLSARPLVRSLIRGSQISVDELKSFRQ